MGVMAAVAGGAIAAGGSIFSGVMGAAASQKQAGAIRYSADKAAETALLLDEKARADLSPFRSLGIESGTIMSEILSGRRNLDDALGDSSLFKWQQSEGERALNRQLTARGLYGSGAGLETLARFNNQLVAEEGTRYWDRLANTTAMGSNAAARMATGTSSTGQSISNMQAQTGMAAAGAIGDAGRSLAGIGTGVANAAMGGLGTWANYQMYQPILSRMAGGSSGPTVSSLNGIGSYSAGGNQFIVNEPSYAMNK